MDAEQMSLLSSYGWAKAISWPDLLQSQRILMVSEAGAGKTYECRAQRDTLWEAGEAAFYIDLAALKGSNFRDLLSSKEASRFDAWLAAQSDIATFFLDSIDELELTQGKFELALKRFEKAVGGQLGRARIVITSRPIPIDRQIFREQLPIPPKADENPSAQSFADVAMRRVKKESKDPSAPPEWRDVALMPLSDYKSSRWQKFRVWMISEALLADIKSRNAREFARRPHDGFAS